ncbi:MAG TPA: M24 family metallopeptidase [Bauldia sp.]|nr:M24 family metallopeptidase [Bauldia sp.]
MPDFHARQQAFLAACDEDGVDAILVCSIGVCLGLNGTAQGHTTFLSGWNAYDSPSVLVIRKDRKPWLLVASHRMKMMALANLIGVDVDWADQTRFGPRILEEVAGSANTRPQRIGICGWEDMLAKPWQTIERAFAGSELIDVAARLTPLRAVKDAEQIAVHRRVAAVCDEMFARLQETKVVGRHTYEIKADLEAHARRRGCDFVQHWMTTGQSPDYPRYYHHENRQIVQPGDTLLYGMMMTIDGIWSHAVRFFYAGEPEPWRLKAQDAVIAYQKRFVERMRPGQDLVRLVADALAECAELERSFPPGPVQMLRLGHGMGCSYAEPGLSDPFPRSFYAVEGELQRSSGMILQPGMLFEIHPMFLFSGGAAGVGDIVLVGDGGAEPLTTTARELFGLPG